MSPVRKFALSPYPDNSTIRTDLLPPNSAQRVVIPSMHTTDNNFLWINVSSLPDFKPSWPAWAAALPRANQLFVSYRVKQPQPGFDSGLVPELSNKVRGGASCVRWESTQEDVRAGLKLEVGRARGAAAAADELG